MKLLSLFKAAPEENTHRRYQASVEQINAHEARMHQLSDSALREIGQGYRGQTIEQLQPHIAEIFAAVREASRRALHMRHFDVQLMGGLSLLSGKIAEMKTGEGKTLVATLPLVVHALTGQGAHLVTVNDYLAKRDAEWMKPIYDFFGLSVGLAIPGLSAEAKRQAYAADITYGTNNEFGFDYLRDNMAQATAEVVQRPLSYAIIDEVDSILIDEARTPLIISAPDSDATRLYEQFSQLVPRLKEGEHYNIDEKRRAVSLTDDGISAVEAMLGIDNIYQERGIGFVHHLEQALRAHTLYHRDKDYVIQQGQVIIVDEFTGRLMVGRRFSEGLHQALEAKETVAVQQESRTLATITFQNFFRLYRTLAGMTGTAATSQEEFHKVYNLDVEVVPTNKPLRRLDKPDRILVNEEAKFKAVVQEIKQRYTKQQPVLVGTVAIEKSEHLSRLLQIEGVPHQVLNAKQHAREAEIVAQAGQPGSVTISTNMAGRGTDIKLGPGVTARGGLFVLGTERHEARRIDNQLRGRSGRQGDPGETQFFVSLDDDVMRIFGGDRIKNLMRRLSIEESEPIENRLVSRALEGAQERVEGYYFDMRKQVLSYDDVLNRQRNAVYSLRRGLLFDGVWREPGKDDQPITQYLQELSRLYVEHLLTTHTADTDMEKWDVEEIAENISSLINEPLNRTHDALRSIVEKAASARDESARERLTVVSVNLLRAGLQAREKILGAHTWQQLQRAACLRAIDTYWMEHLDTMDYLRTGIGLRGYGQRDPLVEYQREGHRLFQRLLETIKFEILEIIFKAQALRPEQMAGTAIHQSATPLGSLQNSGGQAAPPQPNNVGLPAVAPAGAKMGRNDPCPCGSGKKFKKCHGK